MRRLNISPNAYYNFLKNRKEKYHEYKNKIKQEIIDIQYPPNNLPPYPKKSKQTKLEVSNEV